MKDTRENILLVSLRLFAQEGYEAVSVSQIAGELGLTKGALYRHYANKQAILESILQKMEQLDAERAQAFELPEGTVQDIRGKVNTTLRTPFADAHARIAAWSWKRCAPERGFSTRTSISASSPPASSTK